jgi:outer membrane protein assembly factor BamB
MIPKRSTMALSAPRGLCTWIAAVAFVLIVFAVVPAAVAQTESARATSQSGVAPSDHRSKNWPSFRGAGGTGHAFNGNPPITWSAKGGKNILWKTAIARHGMSSPIVSGNRVFLTAADDVVRQVLCYETDTGKLLWHHDVSGIAGTPDQGLPKVLEETGFAAPTAVTDGRQVAAVFATGELVCVNVKGERVWAKHLGIPKNHYGHASSLIAYGTLLIVQYDQKDDSKLLAFDFASGKPAWQAKRGAISWSSPILVENRGRMELILTNSKGVDSHDPKTGKHLWRVECLGGEVVSSAAYSDGVVFVASEGATAAAIDTSQHDAEPKILWQWEESLPDAASPLANKDYLIIPTGFGVVTCLDAKTGKVYWEHQFDKGFNSSPILVNDRVYLVDLSGTTQMFKLDKKFELVGTADLGEDVYATPAFVGGRIYIRGLTHLLCIAEKE